MSDIPEDIRAQAEVVNGRLHDLFDDFWPIVDNPQVQEIVAEALLAERGTRPKDIRAAVKEVIAQIEEDEDWVFPTSIEEALIESVAALFGE